MSKTVFQILLIEKFVNANLNQHQGISCLTQSLATIADKENGGTYEVIWWKWAMDFSHVPYLFLKGCRVIA